MNACCTYLRVCPRARIGGDSCRVEQGRLVGCYRKLRHAAADACKYGAQSTCSHTVQRLWSRLGELSRAMFSVKVSQADYISEGGSGQYIKIDAVPKGQRGSKQVVQAMRQVQQRWLQLLESCLSS